MDGWQPARVVESGAPASTASSQPRATRAFSLGRSPPTSTRSSGCDIAAAVPASVPVSSPAPSALRWREPVAGRAVGLGEGHGHRERDDVLHGGAAGDQVGQRLGAGSLDGGAGSVVDVPPRQGVDRSPGLGGVLGGEGALPPVDTGLVDPPTQTGVGARLLGASAQQVRRDAGEVVAGAPAQVRAVLGPEPRLQRADHRVTDLRWGDLELVDENPGPVGVEHPGAHRVVQPTQTGVGAGAGRAVGGQRHRRGHPPFGVPGGDVQGTRQDRRGVQRHVPRRLVPLHPGAVVEDLGLDRGQPGDAGVLHRGGGVGHLLRGCRSRRPLLASAGSIRQRQAGEPLPRPVTHGSNSPALPPPRHSPPAPCSCIDSSRVTTIRTSVPQGQFASCTTHLEPMSSATSSWSCARTGAQRS